MDYLFLHISNQDIVNEPTREYPWIDHVVHMKASRDKLFNNVDWSPLDIIDVARRELEAWF